MNLENAIGYSIADTAKMLSIGRSRVYQEIQAGNLRAKKIGHRSVVLAESVRAFVDSAPDVTVRQKSW